MDLFSSQLNEILVDTFNHILQYEEDLIKHSENIDLSIGEMHLLETVGKNNNNGKTISDLAQAQNVTLPSMTIAINKLVRKDYVIKEKSPNDGRVVLVRLTKKGLRIERIHQYFHRRMVDEVAKEMSDHEKEVLIHGMEKLNTFFKGKLSNIHDHE
ncbi:MarR family transcriptional regulator [Eubacteriaceae bacterium ES3]|nr:MarR family transcriptional regulator [Eubacteriaceae bacterium ES3]